MGICRCVICVKAYMHSCMHVHTHTHTLVYTHSYTHIHMYKIHMCTNTHTHAHTNTQIMNSKQNQIRKNIRRRRMQSKQTSHAHVPAKETYSPFWTWKPKNWVTSFQIFVVAIVATVWLSFLDTAPPPPPPPTPLDERSAVWVVLNRVVVCTELCRQGFRNYSLKLLSGVWLYQLVECCGCSQIWTGYKLQQDTCFCSVSVVQLQLFLHPTLCFRWQSFLWISLHPNHGKVSCELVCTQNMAKFPVN